MSASPVLQSWKEISAYVGRTERTLQRWETQFGFPVHRPSSKIRSSVMALSEEIQEWMRAKPSLLSIRETSIESPAMPTPIHRSEIAEDGEPGSLRHAASPNHGPLFAKLVSEIHRSRSLEQKQRDLRADVQTLLKMHQTLHKELRQNIQSLRDQRARHEEILQKLYGKPVS